MSLDLVRDVDREHPDLLQRNINATCSAFADLVVSKLRLAGHLAYRMCKTRGEGQFTPPGFIERDVVGLDGKTYRCTGVSHDAIWSDGAQFDLIGQGNDSPDPIFHEDGTPMRGIPTWNAIPTQYWRPNNPPLKDGVSLPPPVPAPVPPPTAPILKSREQFYAEFQELDAYYAAPDGLKRPGGIVIDSAVPVRADTQAMAAWGYDLMTGRSLAECKQAIRHSEEWRMKHPGEQP